MSAATDKSRFYLEQSVPELKEYERKQIFSKVFTRFDYVRPENQLTAVGSRKKSHRSSRSGQILSTKSMLVARSRPTTSATHNMR